MKMQGDQDEQVAFSWCRKFLISQQKTELVNLTSAMRLTSCAPLAGLHPATHWHPEWHHSVIVLANVLNSLRLFAYDKGLAILCGSSMGIRRREDLSMSRTIMQVAGTRYPCPSAPEPPDINIKSHDYFSNF